MFPSCLAMISCLLKSSLVGRKRLSGKSLFHFCSHNSIIESFVIMSPLRLYLSPSRMYSPTPPPRFSFRLLNSFLYPGIVTWFSSNRLFFSHVSDKVMISNLVLINIASNSANDDVIDWVLRWAMLIRSLLAFRLLMCWTAWGSSSIMLIVGWLSGTDLL